MKCVDAVWEVRFLPLAAKFYKNQYLQAIRRSFFMIMPFLLAVVLFDVVESILLDPWGLVMGNHGLNLGYWLTGGLSGDAYRQDALVQMLLSFRNIIGFGYGIVSLILTLALAGRLSDIWDTDRSLTRFCAIAAFLALWPLSHDTNTLTDYFSERGFFPAIFVAFASSWLFARLSRIKKLRLSVPDSFPKEFSRYLVFFFPVTLNLFAFSLLTFLLSLLASVGAETLEGFASMPFFQSPAFALFYQFIVWLLWWFGLPGYAFTSIIQKTIYVPAQVSNQLGDTAAVFTSGFFEAGLLHVLGLMIALLVFSKHEAWRSMAKFSLPCMLCNVQEPLLFGLPIMLNPLFLLPYLFAPLANTLVGWLAISWGIVPVFTDSVPWTMPLFLNGVMGTGSFMGGMLQIVWLVMDIFIYAPFVITANMIELSVEREEVDSHENLHG